MWVGQDSLECIRGMPLIIEATIKDRARTLHPIVIMQASGCNSVDMSAAEGEGFDASWYYQLGDLDKEFLWDVK